MRPGTRALLPTEALAVPPLVVAGRLTAQNDAIAQLDMSQLGKASGGGAASDVTAWPDFHNGVAAGEHMRLPSTVEA